MCKEENNGNLSCLIEIIDTILCLQDTDHTACEVGGCDKPYLGPSPTVFCYNTRPVQFYNCRTGALWAFPYTLNGTDGTSTTFRIENQESDCCTCRVLAPNPDTTDSLNPYVATSTYFTINLNCVSAIQCLGDTFVSNV